MQGPVTYSIVVSRLSIRFWVNPTSCLVYAKLLTAIG
jgi:hypothetical protein